MEPEKPPTAIYEKCIVCKSPCSEGIIRCEECKGGRYCSAACRDIHITTDVHQRLFHSIQELEKLEKSKRVCSVREASQVKLKHQLIRLVGEKPLVNCKLSGSNTLALWDTGAQVSMVEKDWCQQNFPDEKIYSVEEFLEGDDLHLHTANNTVMAVEGVIVLKFELEGGTMELASSIPSLSLKKAEAVVNLIRAESTDVGEARTTSRTVLPT